MLDLALAHKDYRHLLDSFVQWIIELFMDFEKRVIPDHTLITEEDIEELEYWDQEVRKRDVFNEKRNIDGTAVTTGHKSPTDRISRAVCRDYILF